MPGTLLDGKAMAARLVDEVAQDARILQAALGRPPTLAVVLVGEDAASTIYVRRKTAACADAGIGSVTHRLSHDVPEKELLALIDKLNDDWDVDGILVQLPLPSHVRANAVLDRIDPAKDVDGFHPSTSDAFRSVQMGCCPALPWGACSCWKAASRISEG